MFIELNLLFDLFFIYENTRQTKINFRRSKQHVEGTENGWKYCRNDDKVQWKSKPFSAIFGTGTARFFGLPQTNFECEKKKNIFFDILPFFQFVATTVENLLLFDMGLGNSFPFIIISALTGYTNQHNLNETLKITASEASWLGNWNNIKNKTMKIISTIKPDFISFNKIASIGLVFEPIGSILSALITDYLGRKRSMMVVNLPLIIAWFMLYKASSVSQIFIANILLGLGVGLMESPIITYVGEIS